MTDGSTNPLVSVLSGSAPGGLSWEVLAGPESDGTFLTVLDRTLENNTARSGFGGPKLPPGELLNYWTGKADGTPAFVMVRTAPEVESVVAICGSGAEYPLAMSDAIPQFGLRFGATPLPDGEELIDLRTDPVYPISPPRRFGRVVSKDAPHRSGWYPDER
jgi:hypothetical protein